MCRIDEAYPVLPFVLLLTGEHISWSEQLSPLSSLRQGGLTLLCSHHELGGDGPLVLQHTGALRPPGVSLLLLQPGVQDQLV